MKTRTIILTSFLIMSLSLGLFPGSGISVLASNNAEISSMVEATTSESSTRDLSIEDSQRATLGEVGLISSTDSGVTFEVRVPWEKLNLGIRTIDGQQYTEVSLPDWSQTIVEGAPALPFIVNQIGAPIGTDYKLEVIFGKVHTQKLTAPVIPVVTQTVDWTPNAEVGGELMFPDPSYEYLENPVIYQSGSNYPAILAEVSADGMLRQQRVIGISAYPIQYNPQTMELSIYESLKIEVKFTGLPVITDKVLVQDSEAYESILHDELLNYDFAKEWRAADTLTVIQGETQPDRTTIPWAPPNPGWRVKVRTDGIYKLSYVELQSAGLPVTTLDPRTIQLFFKGVQVAIQVEGEGDGVFNASDYILFYGQEIESKYTSDNVYWLTYGKVPQGLRMGTQDGTPGSAGIPAYHMDDRYWEGSSYYRSKLAVAEDLERWLWTRFYPTVPNTPVSWNHIFSLAGPYPSSATLTIALLGDTNLAINPDHHIKVTLNGSLVGDVKWDGTTWQILQMTIPSGLLQSGTNTLTITDPNDLGAYDLVYLDWIDLTFQNTFTVENNALSFVYSVPGTWKYQVTGMSNNQVSIFDVNDPAMPLLISGATVFPSGATYTTQFQDIITTATRYWAGTTTGYQTVQAIESDTASNLQSTLNGADHIVITHATFSTAATSLKDYRASQGLRAQAVDIQDVFDEFNYGIVDPLAIHDFLAYTYNNWQQPAPTYVVLMGDGNYDPKNYLGYGRTNFIPPYLLPVDPWVGETAADNRYVTLVGTDTMPDMILGRISVNSAADASAFVSKIIAYESAPPATWQKQILAVSDNADVGGNFPLISENLVSGSLPAPYQAQKVHLGVTHLTTLAAQEAIKSFINNGVLLVNYIGHGDYSAWASEKLFQTTTVGSLTNGAMQPVVLAMTCNEGYFISPNSSFEAVGEVFTRAIGKGAIASWSPTGYGVASGHDFLNRGFFNAYFTLGVNTVGEAVLAGKLSLWSIGASPDLLDTYTLFGDPATVMARAVKAVNDAYEVGVNTTLTISAPGVLGNDLDSDADPLTAIRVSNPVNGTLALNANGSFNYTPNTNFIGKDSFKYKATDGGFTSNVATVTLNVTDGSVQTHTIALEQGWNLVSFNLQPTSTAIADVLASIVGNYSLVYAWDAVTQAWLVYNPAAPLNSLETLDRTAGFWINANTSDILIVEGTPPTTTNISLKTGWNLVGYPSTVTQGLPGVLTNNGVSNYTIVLTYIAIEADPWKMFDPFGPPYVNDLQALTPGRGYWINVNMDSTWNVINEP
jgi:hypothetical protein